ncbi:MAG: sulfite exporter TauE/SafE family protein [Methanoregulaceae archaeon]|nr:sulfite exporter TauE/SafE family protein [Methanoregulaceae archaeon]
MDPVRDLSVAFLAGVLTPLGAVCVLPLYPAFIAHLARTGTREVAAGRAILPGFTVVAGIISSMLCTGLIFTFLLRTAISSVSEWLTPVLYTVLLAAGILILLDVDVKIPHFGNYFKKAETPAIRAFLFGAFFGLLALPCNPGPLILLFALSTSAVSALENLVLFLLFGVGMALPLLVVSIVSTIRPVSVSGFLSRWRRELQIFSGVALIAISIWYLALYAMNGKPP